MCKGSYRQIYNQGKKTKFLYDIDLILYDIDLMSMLLFT